MLKQPLQLSFVRPGFGEQKRRTINYGPLYRKIISIEDLGPILTLE